MRAGELRHRISIYRQTVASINEYGEEVYEESLITMVYASIEPLSGREGVEVQQVNASLSHRIRIRYCKEIRPSDYIKFGDRRFDIVSIINPGERNRELEIMCAEHLDG